jgi:hypothetical protein
MADHAAAATVRVSTGWSLPAADPSGPDLTGGAAPTVWLGAPAPGGLALPSAQPTDSQLYAPRAVWLDDERLVAADTGNHRVLIWQDPDALADHGPADVILGQPDANSEGPQAGGRGPANGMHLPTGMVVHEGRLVVADAWNHRLLIWDEVPTRSDTGPDHVIGQVDAESVDENAGGDCSASTFYWPFGLAVVDGNLWVADTGNRRVVVFNEIPETGQKPAFILGQPGPTDRDENRGRLGADSFRWPHDITSHRSPDGSTSVLVTDAGNHRILGWTTEPDRDRPADLLFGQPDYETAIELPYAPQSATTLRFPYAIACDTGPGPLADDSSGSMVVTDTANNRLLVWNRPPTSSHTPADRVLGQLDFASIGENRWDLVGRDTLCWPYGVAVHRNRLAVADSGNNRIMVWDLS